MADKSFTVRYLSYRRPFPEKKLSFDTIEAARAEFVKLATADKVDNLSLVGPNTEVLEHYATSGGVVLVLLRDATGYFNTEVWSADRATTVTCHARKAIATRQLMPVLNGLYAAERLREAA